MKQFSIPDRNDPNKNVDIHRYVIDSKTNPTAIIFGKFSPWTGINGHGRLLDYASQFFKDIIIVSPNRKGNDSKVDIFTDDQKEEIIKLANPGFKFMRVSSGFPPKLFSELVKNGIERPVICIGPDRIEEFSKYFIEFDKNNKSIEDTNDKDFGKGEFFSIKNRGSKNTSATKVREALLNNDKEEFLMLTQYNEDMWNTMRNMLKKNKLVESVNLISFNNFYYLINEGGNVVVRGESADKIPMDKINKEQFDELKIEIIDALRAFNKAFFNEYGTPLFPKFEDNVKTRKLFSGSTRLFFDKDFEEFRTFKKKVGDMDLQYPEENRDNLREFLKKNEDKTFGKMIFLGNGGNSPTQENTIFKTLSFSGLFQNIQFDFEPTFFESDVPSEFSTYAHYSSWTDMKNNVKGVFSKFIMRALVSSTERLKDIAVMTKTGKISKSPKYDDVGMRKFSVDKGVRIAFEPVIENVSIKKTEDGKPIYREIETSDSTYERNLDNIFSFVFGVIPNVEEKQKFHSFIGIINLMRKYLDIKTSEYVFDRFLKLMWSMSAQEIDQGSFDENGIQVNDYGIKKAAYDEFVKVFPEFKMSDNELLDYVLPFYTSLKVKKGEPKRMRIK